LIILSFQHWTPFISFLYWFNHNPCGWGRIWLRKLWRGITQQWLNSELENSCIPRKTSRYYLVKYFWAKNGVFGDL
jgi:hypothetical protein